MPTFRPAIKESDNYLERIIKYIPAEIVAGYTALLGYLAIPPGSAIPGPYKTYYLIVFFILLAVTPVWTYFAVIDNNDPPDPVKRKQKAVFHACVATVAFVVWAYALGAVLLKAVLCPDCNTTDCNNCPLYSPVLGSIFLILFTVLTPLLERIFLGPRTS